MSLPPIPKCLHKLNESILRNKLWTLFNKGSAENEYKLLATFKSFKFSKKTDKSNVFSNLRVINDLYEVVIA